jgi:hypothetical protein
MFFFFKGITWLLLFLTETGAYLLHTPQYYQTEIVEIVFFFSMQDKLICLKCVFG